MFALLVALTAATSPVPPVAAPVAEPLDEARHALSSGRLDQARTMIADAVAAGAQGAAVNRLLADLAFAKHDDGQALNIYKTLIQTHPNDSVMIERAGIAAFRIGDVPGSLLLLRQATSLPGAGWRSWNALGAAADQHGNWAEADTCYARALKLAPERAEVANNYGWSLVLRGRWREAQLELARGAALDPSISRLANNLQLARDALATNLPVRKAGESDAAWAARLNDAGVAAAAQGNRARAIAAFAQSIGARPVWDARTAANLNDVEVIR